MDCKHARLLLHFVQPNHPSEVDAEESAALDSHLAHCRACADLADAEHRADESIGRAMRDVVLPDNLRPRVLKRLAAERDAWWRRQLMRLAVPAAVLFLAFWLTQAWWLPQPAKIDADALAVLNNPQIFHADEVEKTFKAEFGVAVVVPEELQGRFGLIRGCGLAVFQKQQVPHLVLVAPGNGRPEVAHVYILSRKQFDWEDARKLPRQFQSDGLHLVVREIDPQSFFIMVYTGNDPNVFLLPPPKPAV